MVLMMILFQVIPPTAEEALTPRGRQQESPRGEHVVPRISAFLESSKDTSDVAWLQADAAMEALRKAFIGTNLTTHLQRIREHSDQNARARSVGAGTVSVDFLLELAVDLFEDLDVGITSGSRPSSAKASTSSRPSSAVREGVAKPPASSSSRPSSGRASSVASTAQTVMRPLSPGSVSGAAPSVAVGGGGEDERIKILRQALGKHFFEIVTQLVKDLGTRTDASAVRTP